MKLLLEKNIHSLTGKEGYCSFLSFVQYSCFQCSDMIVLLHHRHMTSSYVGASTKLLLFYRKT
jgi:hypothetical protein